MSTPSTEEKSALILIGFQEGLDEIEYWGPQRNNPKAEQKARQLLDVWRNLQLPIIHIQIISNDRYSPLHPDNPGCEFKEELKPHEHEYVIINKDDAVDDIRKILYEEEVKTVVFAGVPTDRCVSSAIYMVSTYGYSTFVVYDATATFGRSNPRIKEQMYSAELIHDTALASINNEFASVIMTDDLIEVMKHCNTNRVSETIGGKFE